MELTDIERLAAEVVQQREAESQDLPQVQRARYRLPRRGLMLMVNERGGREDVPRRLHRMDADRFDALARSVPPKRGAAAAMNTSGLTAAPP
jgi:hypothetical protein